jgi:CubicO group peptidase (beta-lactamase class C family)
MVLVEDGKLALDDPVAKYIPAFADVKVGVETRDQDGKPALVLEPLNRPITIEDLLRHTSGLTYGFYGDSAVRNFISRPICSKAISTTPSSPSVWQNCRWLNSRERSGITAIRPTCSGASSRWSSGQTLLQFEKQRLLDPLGMTDTAFYVADRRSGRASPRPMPVRSLCHAVAGIRDPMVPRRWESGGAGMVWDHWRYARFAQMLLNGGTFEGRRYLKPETIALMTSDHIGPETKIARDYFYFPGASSGFGLGFAVRTSPIPGHPGRWRISLGRHRRHFFFIDPKDDMFVIFMVQTPSQRGRIQLALKTLIYEALRN